MFFQVEGRYTSPLISYGSSLTLEHTGKGYKKICKKKQREKKREKKKKK